MSDTPQDAAAVEEAAQADHEATQDQVPGRDGGPQDTDDMRAAEGLHTPPEAADAYQDMLERGAEQKGEGRTP